MRVDVSRSRTLCMCCQWGMYSNKPVCLHTKLCFVIPNISLPEIAIIALRINALHKPLQLQASLKALLLVASLARLLFWLSSCSCSFITVGGLSVAKHEHEKSKRIFPHLQKPCSTDQILRKNFLQLSAPYILLHQMIWIITRNQLRYLQLVTILLSDPIPIPSKIRTPFRRRALKVLTLYQLLWFPTVHLCRILSLQAFHLPPHRSLCAPFVLLSWTSTLIIPMFPMVLNDFRNPFVRLHQGIRTIRTCPMSALPAIY